MFVSEVVGTGLLVLLGCGVVANVALAESKGAGGGFLMVNFGWGLGVLAGVFAAFKSGAHINPAVTLGLIANGAEEYLRAEIVYAASHATKARFTSTTS